MTELIFPDRPTCHDKDAFARRFGEVTWREPDSGRPFRFCSFCGSMHPEDLMKAVGVGAKLGGSDWKYGWPHKFYVDNIPDPEAGQLRRIGGISLGLDENRVPRTPSDAERARYTNWRQNEYGGWEGDLIAPAPATTRGKWYNVHLTDLVPETFAALAPVIDEKTQIRFSITEGKLYYEAPYRGYQA